MVSEAAAPARPRIGGWLILPAVGLVAAPIADLVALVTDAQAWPTVNAAFAPLIAFEGAANLVMVALDLIVAVAFFQRRSAAPKLFVGWLVARLFTGIVDYVWLSGVMTGPQSAKVLQDSMMGVLRSLTATIFWAAYFRRSVRVQQTFNPLAEVVHA